MSVWSFFFFQAEDGIRDTSVTGVQTCALPICPLDSRQPDFPPVAQVPLVESSLQADSWLSHVFKLFELAKQSQQSGRDPVDPGAARNGGEVALAVFVYPGLGLAGAATGERLLEGGALGLRIWFLHEPEVDPPGIPPLHIQLLPPQHEGGGIHLFSGDLSKGTRSNMSHGLNRRGTEEDFPQIREAGDEHEGLLRDHRLTSFGRQ